MSAQQGNGSAGSADTSQLADDKHTTTGNTKVGNQSTALPAQADDKGSQPVPEDYKFEFRGTKVNMVERAALWRRLLVENKIPYFTNVTEGSAVAVLNVAMNQRKAAMDAERSALNLKEQAIKLTEKSMKMKQESYELWEHALKLKEEALAMKDQNLNYRQQAAEQMAEALRMQENAFNTREDALEAQARALEMMAEAI
ncbi:hypothetical protein HD806DRAFT_102691 [Xylariaceae sp. AK1471]|nr:hypothetical protein HD806DRAFT_102691 [Xylariaceae sp. AK1471]